MIDTARWADTARLRQGLYRFFGGALLPPEGDRVESLLAAAAYLDDLGIEAFAFAGPWNAMLDAFEALPSSDELSTEYIRLFASGMDGELCPPTESFYRSAADGGGMATAVALVQRDYAEMGLSVVGTSQPPDHGTSQLEAMAGLCGRELAAWTAEKPDRVLLLLDAEQSFLRRHLAAWFPAFHARVEQSSRLPLYAATVGATHAFLVHEVDFLGWMRRGIEKDR